MIRFVSCLCLCLAVLVGCNKGSSPVSTTTQLPAKVATPVFTHSISEYPSWTVYLVAAKYGWINPKQGGELGELEKKYNVDVVINAVDYDKCIELFGNGATDAVCITNMDVLPLAKTRNCTAILPTSTSAGADQCIVSGIADLDELKNHEIHLLTKSVSEYTVFRVLEKNGRNIHDYKLKHLDPAAAATALQSNSSSIKAICVWNPFALSTTKKNKTASVLFSSDQIAGEIVDMVVIGNDAKNREGGENFAKCLCEGYYRVAALINDPATQGEALKLLAEDFAPDLSVEDMKIVVAQTRFYSTPKAGHDLFTSPAFREVNKTVARVCEAIETLPKDRVPSIGYGEAAELSFDAKYIDAVK